MLTCKRDRGSTLSLAYAQKHPDRVRSLTLRGIFTVRLPSLCSHSPFPGSHRSACQSQLRRAELDYFYNGPGTNFIFPEYWDEYIAVIPEAERGDMIAAY